MYENNIEYDNQIMFTNAWKIKKTIFAVDKKIIFNFFCYSTKILKN